MANLDIGSSLKNTRGCAKPFGAIDDSRGSCVIERLGRLDSGQSVKETNVESKYAP